ncbi:MAG: hypothetical protein H3C27_15560 [Opitutaceae bacterium]|nr:hypothetical protein [Opitutaceae bacterium]
MAITFDANKYQIPRGRVYFDPFDANDARTGERHLGNCPAFAVAAESEKADHYSSETGLREKDDSTLIEINRTAKMTVDNMTAANVALFLAGSEETVSQTADAVVAEEIDGVVQGRFYQLGQSTSQPAGWRNVSAVVVKDDATPTPTTFTVGDDYEVDAALGRIRIVVGGAITSGTNLRIDYSKPATTWGRIKTGSSGELRGALRIVADNAKGDNRDWYCPLVTLTPDGEIPVIAEGTDYSTMGFSVDILKPANAEAIYIDGRPA